MTAINSNRAIRGPVTAVPVVAGKGVRLVADIENNRWVVEADETVLWSGSPGIYLNNDTATLSETFTNFDRVAIYAVSVYGGPARRFEFDVSADNSQFRFMTNSLDGASILNVAFNLNITGTTATISRSKLIMVQYSTNAITTSDLSSSSTYKSYITSIVGINRIASN